MTHKKLANGEEKTFYVPDVLAPVSGTVLNSVDHPSMDQNKYIIDDKEHALCTRRWIDDTDRSCLDL